MFLRLEFSHYSRLECRSFDTDTAILADAFDSNRRSSLNRQRCVCLPHKSASRLAPAAPAALLLCHRHRRRQGGTPCARSWRRARSAYSRRTQCDTRRRRPAVACASVDRSWRCPAFVVECRFLRRAVRRADGMGPAPRSPTFCSRTTACLC